MIDLPVSSQTSGMDRVLTEKRGLWLGVAAWLGAVMGPEPNGILGAAIALLALFLPGFLMLVGALPF